MVDQIIPPSGLPTERTNPNPSEFTVVDNGSTVAKATIENIVLSGRPTASQPEAEAGVDAIKAMTPLTTKQSIASEIGVSIASKSQGDKADTAVQPGGLALVATTGDYNDLNNKPVIQDATSAESRGWAIANLHPDSAPTYIRTSGYSSPGDLGGALYKNVPTEPSHPGKLSITLSDTVTVAWYEIAEVILNPLMFGGAGDAAADDTASLSSAFATATTGGKVDLAGKNYKFSTLAIAKALSIANGTLTSTVTNAVNITVSPSARVTWRNVNFVGGGSELTYNGNHNIVSQIGASSASRAVGMDFVDCSFSGAGYAGLYMKWSNNINVERCRFLNIAYVGAMFLSCNVGIFSKNRIDMQNAVGTSSNAYGMSLTHDSTNYNTDPNAGTPQALNPFSNGWFVSANTIIAPKIWTGLDAHGGYGITMADNMVYGAKVGISLASGSNAAANYAGYDNAVRNNLITIFNQDGTSVSGLTPQYGIVSQGGSTVPHTRVSITGNHVVGYSVNSKTSACVPIYVNVYADRVVCSGNIIEGWSGFGIYLSQGTKNVVVNDNMFSTMTSNVAISMAIFHSGNTSDVYISAIGNVLSGGSFSPAYGVYINDNTTGSLTYGGQMSLATVSEIAKGTATITLRNMI